MTAQPGQIVKNLGSEQVTINKIQEFGNMVSISYTGVISRKANDVVISRQEYENLEVVADEGSFNFQGDPARFLMVAEAERIYSAYMFDPLFAVNCSIVDPLPHQVEAVYKFLLPQPKIRFLLADDTGAGKTIMTGLLIKELMMRGLVERILVITPGGLTKQWQEDEMGIKFNIPFKLVNRAAFMTDPTIFSHSDRLITSIDFLRADDIMNVLKETAWDIIVVDEAHKLSAFDYGKKRYTSKRYQVMEMLAARCEHLLLLTATPHRGRRDTFKNLLRLLDEDIFASDSLVTERIREVEENGVNRFFIRRLKEEMKDWNGEKLFKPRFTRTALYQLTPEEKTLYEGVTQYLTEKRHEAREDSNIHVSLALMVMQRRLTSSIYAIMKTLKNRYNALKNLERELDRKPDLWKQKQRIDRNFDTANDIDELDDEEKETLGTILSDPRQFRLFTTAKSPAELKTESGKVRELMEMAGSLYDSNLEECKLIRLRQLLQSNGVLDNNEKLVIFTEHKDTLEYLEQRLTNNGYSVVVIHGGKSVEERREVQTMFAGPDAQIMIATDAAGEGINLQFCRLMINWDIPWNPNRLEQRMGRIHRYGQKKDVIVFNMVAENTREGYVLRRLLEKLDLIREQMGDDRVYDVISDIFQEVELEEIISATFDGDTNIYLQTIDTKFNTENVSSTIENRKKQLAVSTVDYKDARQLKETSDEKRLQPIYIRLFFERAFKALGGSYKEIETSIFKIKDFPSALVQHLKTQYNISVAHIPSHFAFDKDIFLDMQNFARYGRAHYINPGNPIFDSLVSVVRREYKEDMLKGTVLVSPDDSEDYFAFLVKSQVIDQRTAKAGDSVVDEELRMVGGVSEPVFTATSPAKFIDLYPPSRLAVSVDPPMPVDSSHVINWCFEHITLPQLERTKNRVHDDVAARKHYLEEAFRNSIFQLTEQIEKLNHDYLLGKENAREKIERKQKQIEDMEARKVLRLENLDRMKVLNMKPPTVLGCAYVRSFSSVEYSNCFGMSRDDQVEAVAMETAMEYERRHGRTPEDVSKENAGYDIRSTGPEGLKRYIEVKGRSADGGVMLSENEMNRLDQLGNSAWLYIVTHCKSTPKLFRFRNPARLLTFQAKTKGIQYYLPPEEWKRKVDDHDQ